MKTAGYCPFENSRPIFIWVDCNSGIYCENRRIHIHADFPKVYISPPFSRSRSVCHNPEVSAPPYSFRPSRYTPTEASPNPSITRPERVSSFPRSAHTVTATPIAVGIAFSAISLMRHPSLFIGTGTDFACIRVSMETPSISARYGIVAVSGREPPVSLS